MAQYKGPKSCPGCGISGEKNPRPSVESLCKGCTEALAFGRSRIKDEHDNYVRVVATWYKLEFGNAGYFGEDRGGKALDRSIRALLKSMDTKGIWGLGSVSLTTQEATTAADYYTIRKDYAEAILEIVKALTFQEKLLADGLDQVEKDRKEVVRKERNKIFNLGVSEGKSLLIALNRGDISLSDFDQEQKRY